ncbi:hypothetical protein B0H11DRAFT_2248179 [Mycena galericulata]|nr:hypothetical protein B0H11DRAFT_2248179 [Mycena galericulata]
MLFFHTLFLISTVVTAVHAHSDYLNNHSTHVRRSTSRRQAANAARNRLKDIQRDTGDDNAFPFVGKDPNTTNTNPFGLPSTDPFGNPGTENNAGASSSASSSDSTPSSDPGTSSTPTSDASASSTSTDASVSSTSTEASASKRIGLSLDFGHDDDDHGQFDRLGFNPISSHDFYPTNDFGPPVV